MVARIRHLARRLHTDTAGAMSVEKILIIALIALPILILLVLFRNQIEGWFNTQSATLNTDANGN